MNKTTIESLSYGIPTVDPTQQTDMQIGLVLLFFFTCMFIVFMLSLCLFGQRMFAALKWMCSASCLRCWLKCCCPACCARTYRRMIDKASQMVDSATDNDDVELEQQRDWLADIDS